MQKLKILPWMIFGISLLFTLIISIGFLNSESELQYVNFHTNVEFMTNSIFDELTHYEQVLVGAKGLFAASSIVEHVDWKNFVNVHDLDKRFPGIQGISYVHHITNEERNNSLDELKNYGLDNYTIKPEGIRDEYYLVTFLEPQNFRNKRAMGYDIYSEETRHNAIDLMKETGQTTITGKIILVQETETNTQNGFLMLVPIYTNDQNSSSDLEGLVSMVLRMNDFINNTLDPQLFQYIHMRIYDDVISEDNLFFDSDDNFTNKINKIDFSETITISVNNRDWVFVYEGIQPPIQGIPKFALFFIPVMGIPVSFLLFYVVRLFTRNLKLTQEAIQTEKMSIIGTMASRLAHDLRNPLAVIKNTMEIIQLDLGENQNTKTKTKFERVTKAITRIDDQVENVLDFVKDKPMNLKSHNLSEILENVISRIPNPDTVKISLPKNDVKIMCDLHMIEVVFINLITNALDAIKNEGHIKIILNELDDHIQIKVEDSGEGIPKNALSQIFDPLYTTKMEGTGLGLVSCKNIIKQHNGTIFVTNNPTTFTIELPKS